jgi:hypothetical protein
LHHQVLSILENRCCKRHSGQNHEDRHLFAKLMWPICVGFSGSLSLLPHRSNQSGNSELDRVPQGTQKTAERDWGVSTSIKSKSGSCSCNGGSPRQQGAKTGTAFVSAGHYVCSRPRGHHARAGDSQTWWRITLGCLSGKGWRNPYSWTWHHGEEKTGL